MYESRFFLFFSFLFSDDVNLGVFLFFVGGMDMVVFGFGKMGLRLVVGRYWAVLWEVISISWYWLGRHHSR